MTYSFTVLAFREFLSQSSGAVRVMDAGCGLGLDLCEMAQVAEESGKVTLDYVLVPDV